MSPNLRMSLRRGSPQILQFTKRCSILLLATFERPRKKTPLRTARQISCWAPELFRRIVQQQLRRYLAAWVHSLFSRQR